MPLRLKKLLFWAFPALGLGCGGGGGTDVVLPSLNISTTTSGVELDPDGYGVVVDGTQGPGIGLNATLVVDGLSDGTHSVTLSGLAQNCAIQGDNPRIVSVASGATARVPFAISCSASAGNIAVVTATTGTEFKGRRPACAERHRGAALPVPEQLENPVYPGRSETAFDSPGQGQNKRFRQG